MILHLGLNNLLKIYLQFYLKCLQDKHNLTNSCIQNKLIQKKILKGNYDTRKKKKKKKKKHQSWDAFCFCLYLMVIWFINFFFFLIILKEKGSKFFSRFFIFSKN